MDHEVVDELKTVKEQADESDSLASPSSIRKSCRKRRQVFFFTLNLYVGSCSCHFYH